MFLPVGLHRRPELVKGIETRRSWGKERASTQTSARVVNVFLLLLDEEKESFKRQSHFPDRPAASKGVKDQVAFVGVELDHAGCQFLGENRGVNTAGGWSDFPNIRFLVLAIDFARLYRFLVIMTHIPVNQFFCPLAIDNHIFGDRIRFVT